MHLSKEVRDAGFKIAPSVESAKVYHPIFGIIHFSKLTVDRADYLVNAGYTGLTKTANSVNKKKIVEKQPEKEVEHDA